jgi:chromate transporter
MASYKETEKIAVGDENRPDGSFFEVLAVFSRLGVTSFGGPIAHLGYFRAEIVQKRKWVDDQTYADLVALCQFLPGPASSQVGISLGIARAGLWGGLAAWLGFTLPSAIALTLFALGVNFLGSNADLNWLQGLKIVAVAVVAQAVWGMASNLCPDRPRVTMAILGAIFALAFPSGLGQIGIIIGAGIAGWFLFKSENKSATQSLKLAIPRGVAISCLVVFFGLLFALPLARQFTPNQTLAMIDSYYRSGSLVFGGGHVVLPLLETEVVPTGWVSEAQFIAGYGAAQAVPGPLFTFSAYLGAVQQPEPNGWVGATIALLAIFFPSFLLVIGGLPFWNDLRSNQNFQAVLKGINAGVVGILLAALYDPVWTSAIKKPSDFALALAAFGLLMFWKLPPWAVVLLSGLAGAGLYGLKL